MTSSIRDSADDGSWGILLFFSALALAAVACLDAALIPAAAPRLAVLVAAVAVLSERTVDPRTALGSGLLAFAIGDGFLQHHDGTLGWTFAIDYPFVLGLLGAVALGMCAGQIRLARRRHRIGPFIALLRGRARTRSAGTPAARAAMAGQPVRGHRHVVKEAQRSSRNAIADSTVTSWHP